MRVLKKNTHNVGGICVRSCILVRYKVWVLKIAPAIWWCIGVISCGSIFCVWVGCLNVGSAICDDFINVDLVVVGAFNITTHEYLRVVLNYLSKMLQP